MGWERLRVVLEDVARRCAGGHAIVQLNDALRVISGDLAYESGMEEGEGVIAGAPTVIRHRVTNIYRRESGGWKLVHRHTDLNPAEQDVAQELDSLSTPSE